MAVNLKDLIDIDLLAYFKSKLDLLFAGKVDKVDGKGLSTNDYTADEKTKLAGIATGAQVNTIEGIQVVGNSVTPANKIVNIPAASQSAPGVMTAEDKTKLDGVSAGAQANVIESVKVNGTPLTVTNKAVDVSVPTAVTDLTDADDYATKDYVDTNGGKIDKINVNGVEQTISAADKSVDLDIDDIAWFDAVITTNAFGVTTINPTNVTLTKINSAIAAGKYPVMVASYTDSPGPGDYYLYMPLTQFYPERTNEVIPVQGDIVVFEGQLGDKHYRLKYFYDSVRYKWISDIDSFAHKGDAEGMVHYLNFVETDTTAGDGFLVTAKDDEGNDISAAQMATDIRTYYNGGKAIYAKIVLIDGTTMTIPFGSVNGSDLYFYSFDAVSGVGRVLYYISNDFAWYIQYVSHSEEIDDIYTALEGKVDVVDGKGLSTEDYTTAEKTKLAGIATGAQANVIESVKVNGTALTVTNKAVDVTVPTKTSDITNDSGFITINDVPEGAAATTTTPKMDGTATVGTETAFARGDHIHPHDTTKVDKVSGKGLSTEDYTTAEKTKLSGIDAGAQVNVIEGISTDNGSSTITPNANKIVVLPTAGGGSDGLMSSSDYTKLQDIASGAEVNVIESVKVNGSEVTVTNKTVDIDVPTTVAELTDADNYVTDTEFENTISSSMSTVSAALNQKADASSVYTKTEIDQKLVGAMNYKGTKATTAALPSSGNVQGDVWHVTADGSEWAWNGSAWEELGTVIDLSGYVEEDDIGLATTADIDDLFAPTVIYSASTVSTFIDEVPDKNGAITWSKSFSEYTFAYSGAAVKVNWTVMTPEDSTKYRIVSASKNSFTVELKENVSTLAVNAETL